jgi:uncharacterized protein (UPF0248 family)
MFVKIRREYIQIENMVLKRNEFRLLCGALRSVTECKEKEIYTNICCVIKNERYEVLLDKIQNYELEEWRKNLQMLELLFFFPITLPQIPPHKVIEIKKGGKIVFSRWKCDRCGKFGNRDNFVFPVETLQNICFVCQEQELQQQELQQQESQQQQQQQQ